MKRSLMVVPSPDRSIDSNIAKAFVRDVSGAQADGKRVGLEEGSDNGDGYEIIFGNFVG
jgi:hypothetical protein